MTHVQRNRPARVISREEYNDIVRFTRSTEFTARIDRVSEYFRASDIDTLALILGQGHIEAIFQQKFRLSQLEPLSGSASHSAF